MPADYKTKLVLRIDWADLDLFGHVNNVAFFRYIQAARVNYCDQIGLSSLNETPLSFMVASTQCHFKKPLRYPGDLTVYTKIAWIKNTSMQLDHLLLNPLGEVVAEGIDVLVVYDHKTGIKAGFTEALRKSISAIEGKEILSQG
jgi:acyl-CoA thioester hydrolase